MSEESIPDLSPEEAKKARKRAYHLAWSARNRDCINGYRLNRLAREGDALRAADQQRSQHYYATHKEEHAAAVLRWQRKNPDKVAAQHARWYAKAKATGGEAFLEKERAQGLVQRAKHGKKYLAQHKQWLKEHPEIKLAGQRKRRASKANAPVNDFTAKEWRALCKASGYCCAYCQKKFPFKQLTMDHITPLSKGGSHTLANILPACLSCNSRKNAGNVLKPVQPFLLLDETAAD